MTSSVKTRPLGYFAGFVGSKFITSGRRPSASIAATASSSCVIAGMAHQVHEHGRPALAIVDRLAGIVFKLGVVGVEEAADRWVAGAIDVEQLAVLPDAASSQTRIGYLLPSSLVGSSNTVEKTLASVFESTPVQGALTPTWSEVKFLSPSGLYRFLIPS